MHAHALYRGLLGALFLLALGACAMGERQLPKEPVITYTPVHLDIHYPQHDVILSDGEAEKLQAFLAGHARNPGGNIALMAAAPDSPVTSERLADVKRQMHGWGYPSVVIVTHASVPRDRIRIGSSTATATAPDCPDWSYAHMANHRNSVLSNFGCAHATNLVRMVEDPNDLVAGTGDNSPDAQRGSGVIEVYRAPPPSPASVEGPQTGGM